MTIHTVHDYPCSLLHWISLLKLRISHLNSTHSQFKIKIKCDKTTWVVLLQKMRNCRFFKLHRRQLFCDIKQPRLFYSPGVKQPKPHPQKRNVGKKTTQKRRQEYLNFRRNITGFYFFTSCAFRMFFSEETTISLHFFIWKSPACVPFLYSLLVAILLLNPSLNLNSQSPNLTHMQKLWRK